MANELTIMTQGDALTIYVIIRRHSDGKVWDVANTTWATWVDGNIGDYDIPLTARDGDLYQGDFPSDIAAGTRVQTAYYYQDGGAPATDDVLLWRRDVTWDGTGLSSSSSVTLDSRALTDLDSVKRRLNITGSADDTVLTELINQASDMIERRVGRRFKEATYIEFLCPGVEGTVLVRNYPITRVKSIRYGLKTGLTVRYTGTDILADVAVVYDEEGQNGKLITRSVSAAGTETENTLTFANNPTNSTLATAVTALTDWTGTVQTDMPSRYLFPYGPADAKNELVELDYGDRDDHQPMVKHSTGLIRFRGGVSGMTPHGRLMSFDAWVGQAPATGQYIMVEYTGGYATVPDDVRMVANDMVAHGWAKIQVNPLAQSESLGDWSYTLKNAIDMTAEQEAALRPYMNFAVGRMC